MDKTFSINQYNLRIYDDIRKIATGPGDDYTTGCLLDYSYFKNYYKMIVIDADPKATQQINFTSNLRRPGNTTRNYESIAILFCFNIIPI